MEKLSYVFLGREQNKYFLTVEFLNEGILWSIESEPFFLGNKRRNILKPSWIYSKLNNSHSHSLGRSVYNSPSAMNHYGYIGKVLLDIRKWID